MDFQGWFTLLLTLAVLLGMSVGNIRPHIATMAALAALSLLGILTPTEALAGFANSGLITVAAMFVVAAGLHASGAVDLLVDMVLGRPDSVRSAFSRMFGPVVTLSAFLNNTPVVATMIPAVHMWCRRIGIAPSKLMIPLSYSSILGGTITLIGTSTNLVVNGQYEALTGKPGFSIFSITALGLPVALLGLLFMWLFFPRLLPDRSDQKAFGNLREFTLEVTVADKGPLVGKSVQEAGLRHLGRVYLAEIERRGVVLTAVSSEQRLQGGDRLVFAGDTDAISDLLRVNGLVASTENGAKTMLETERAERRLVEVVVSPHCSAIGEAIRDARFRDRYGAVVLAVARNGERVKGNLGTIKLTAGDTLLLEARPAFVTRQRHNKDFLLVNDTNSEAPRHEKAILAWVILGALVLAAGFDVVSMLDASLVGAGLMIATGCCSTDQAEKSLDLRVLVTIGASFALGAALEKTGVASLLASRLIDLSGGRPWLLLALVYVAVSLLTEAITNNSAAILVLPVVIGVCEKAGLNEVPFVFAVMMAASASFATPIGYQTNLMVHGPGGYRFSDFVRVGVPMNVFIGVVSVALILLLWPLR